MPQKAPSIPLPTDWPKHVKMGVLHVIALVQVALTGKRCYLCLLEEELRLKDLRMERLTPRGGPRTGAGNAGAGRFAPDDTFDDPRERGFSTTDPRS